MSLIRFLTIDQYKHLINEKTISPSEIIQETKKLFALHNDSLNAAIEIFEEKDITYNSNSHTSLFSIPGIIKDVISQKNKKLTCCSHILENFISPYNATVIERLQLDGALCIGRANCDEFGMGSSNESSFFGPVSNPWNLDCVPGGSSGGSAAAVAAGLVPFALGAETGGSVRQPAALCGIVGLKPTYGIVSRYGVVAYASSVDQVGVFSRTVHDNALVFSSIAGKDNRDGTSTAPFDRYDFTKNINQSIKGKKIAIVKNAMMAEGIESDVQKKLLDVIEVYKKLGCTIEEIDLSTMQYSAAIYIVISRAEVASNLARYDGIRYGHRAKDYKDLESLYSNTRREGFGASARRRIMIGNYVLSAGYEGQYYEKATRLQNLMRVEFFNALSQYDALFLPTSPGPAFKKGEMAANSLAIDLQDYFTAPANLTGIPGISIPCGFVNDLPIGFQLFTKQFDEETLFQLGHAYQKETDWHTKKPSL
jgi:aspartyl-tRNA(Asn)/glutamyl-tRNA(Gln) amidotransferase subunit A